MYILCKILKYASEIIWGKILLKIEHSVFEKYQEFFVIFSFVFDIAHGRQEKNECTESFPE